MEEEACLATKSMTLMSSPFSSIFSKADRALLVFTFPNISVTFVAVLKKRKPVIVYPNKLPRGIDNRV